MADSAQEDAVVAADAALAGVQRTRVRIAPELQQDVEQFLYYEAELLDNREIAEWVDLMTDDVRYFMPLRRNRGQRERDREYSGDGDTAYFDESNASLRMRLAKLQTNVAWAEEPPSRTRHLITNVRIRPLGDIEFEVKSAFLLYRNRAERQTDVFAGERIDVLRRGATAVGWQIARRVIHLDQAVLLANNLSVFF